MSDDKSPKTTGAVAAILNALPSEVRAILSLLLLFFVFMLVISSLSHMPTFLKNASGAWFGKQECWELRELASGVWKFDKCTGESVLLVPTEALASPPVNAELEKGPSPNAPISPKN